MPRGPLMELDYSPVKKGDQVEIPEWDSESQDFTLLTSNEVANIGDCKSKKLNVFYDTLICVKSHKEMATNVNILISHL